MRDWVKCNVLLILHATSSGVSLSYPQLMVTSLPLQTVVSSGGVVIVTIEYTQIRICTHVELWIKFGYIYICTRTY